MSRPLVVAALVTALAAPAVARSAPPGKPPTPPPPTAKPAPSWAQAEIRTVVAHGLMAKSVALFRPNDPLTQGALAALVAGLLHKPSLATAYANANAPVTMAQLDARLVQALGLGDAAGEFASAASAAGLAPPARFGTEVVARILGLRTNHPARQDDLELLPTDPATRAEAAFSAARILGLGAGDLASVEQDALTFALPQLGPWQKKVLQTAVRFIGYPYVWGGTSETTEAPFGVTAHGGFDCSGFVWRVFKLQPYLGGAALGTTLRGRTTFAMSGEVPAAKRIAIAKLGPADVLFWGAHGPRSKPSEVDHTGIYLGNGWFIHSSSYGVALAQLDGWYKQRFAWARRPLVEAGLGR